MGVFPSHFHIFTREEMEILKSEQNEPKREREKSIFPFLSVRIRIFFEVYYEGMKN